MEEGTGRDEGRMGGLERDKWGHPAVISIFLSAPVLNLSFLSFPGHFSSSVLSFCFNQCFQFNFTFRRLHLPTAAWYRWKFCSLSGLGTQRTLISTCSHTVIIWVHWGINQGLVLHPAFSAVAVLTKQPCHSKLFPCWFLNIHSESSWLFSCCLPKCCFFIVRILLRFKENRHYLCGFILLFSGTVKMVLSLFFSFRPGNFF